MSSTPQRELRPRVCTSNVGLVGDERRRSSRKSVPRKNYAELSDPIKSPLRKIQETGSSSHKKSQPVRAEHKRRKFEDSTSESHNSTLDSPNQSILSSEAEQSSSSACFESPNKWKSNSGMGRRLRPKGPNMVAKKLVKNAVGTARAKRQLEANPGTSSSLLKSENTPKSNKGTTKRKADSSTCDNDVLAVEPIHNSLEIPQCPLPCREEQFEKILKFIKDNIEEKTSGCIYVSGVPGSGKTAIVHSVIDTLDKVFKKSTSEVTPLFKHVYINGLSLGSPDRIWKRFYHGLHHDKIKLTSPTALKKLESYFETKSRVPVVLIVDELDQLLDKQQSILYKLLEWTSHPSTMFSLVAIFNTMNIPENVFTSRNSSRMGLSRVIFPSYNHTQLQIIVSNFLADQSSTKLSPDAIGLLSKKVAALSGDARRALEISKRAVEIVEEGSHTGIKAVNEAFKEIFSSPTIDTVKDCSMLEQLFLKTVSHEQQRTGIEETTLMTVQSNIGTCAPFEGFQWSPDQFLTAASKLVSMKLLVAENDSSSLHKKISLNIPVEDINYALNINTNATSNGHHD